MAINEIWQEKSLSELIGRIEVGVSVLCHNRTKQLGEFGVLKTSSVGTGIFTPEEHKAALPEEIAALRVNPRADSIIICRSNTPDLVGTSAYVAQDYPDLFLPDTLWQTADHNLDDVNVRWLAYLFNTPFFRDQIKQIASGTSANMKKISQQNFALLRVPLPPLPEQRAIAAILSTWDEAITLTTRLIDALKRRKQALMQLLLTGEVRFAGSDGEWESVQLGQLFKKIARKNKVGNTNVLTISARYGLISQTQFFNKVVAGEKVEEYYLLKHGEFAYNRSYSTGYPYGAVKRLDEYPEGILSTLYLCFQLVDEAQDSDFWTYFFESGVLNRGIYMIAQEGARNHGLLNVGVEEFFEIAVKVPDSEEQRKLAQFFTTVDEATENIIMQRDKLRAQKRGLMQQLLTGSVRVPIGKEEE